MFAGFRVEARNDKSVTPHTMRGPEEDKRDFHLQGLCRYLPHAVFPRCGYSLDSASERGMTERVTPHLDAGARRGQTRHSFTGSLPVFTSCCILPLRLLSGFRVGARNDRARHPAHDAGSRRGQARHSFTRSLPVFTSCGIPTLRLLSGFRVGARNDYIRKRAPVA